MTRYRILAWLSILILLVSLTSVVRAHPQSPAQSGKALVYVPLAVPGDPAGRTETLTRFARTGLPVYARLHDLKGEYLLTGAGPAERDTLVTVGLSFRVLDADMAGAAYYLVYLMPGQPTPDWDAYGRVLLDDGVQVLMRVAPRRAEGLVEAGTQLRALTLDPKPLPPDSASRGWPSVVQPDPFVKAMIDQVDSTTVYSYTGDLSGEWPVTVGGPPYTIDTRHTYSGVPILRATQYVGEHLVALGLDVEYHQWGDSTYPNVIGELVGETNPDDIYIICAHLDDMPQYPPAPGADDNASGSVAVLIAADILTQYRWGCTLRFAFWTGEEQGLHGSHYYAQRAYNDGENIVGVLNLDMIAWNTPESSPGIDLIASSSVPGSLGLTQLFVDVVDAYDLNLIPEIKPNGTGASDHASFWTYGYDAILGIEDMSDFNPRYHTSNDLLAYLDLPYYTDFVKASLATFVHMTDCLILTDCAPVQDADFTWLPFTPVAGDAVAFTGTASSTLPVAFTWNFGDGSTGVGWSTSHTYAEDDYTVTMTATNCADPLVVVSHALSVLCAEITGVDLSIVTADTIYTDTLVQFSANLNPDGADKPYTYTVRVDGETVIAPQPGSDDPLAFQCSFAVSGTYAVEVQVWNCDMSVPISDVAQVSVVAPSWHVFCYLPLAMKGD